jgi:hypothetical protein
MPEQPAPLGGGLSRPCEITTGRRPPILEQFGSSPDSPPAPQSPPAKLRIEPPSVPPAELVVRVVVVADLTLAVMLTGGLCR